MVCIFPQAAVQHVLTGVDARFGEWTCDSNSVVLSLPYNRRLQPAAHGWFSKLGSSLLESWVPQRGCLSKGP